MPGRSSTPTRAALAGRLTPAWGASRQVAVRFVHRPGHHDTMLSHDTVQRLTRRLVQA